MLVFITIPIPDAQRPSATWHYAIFLEIVKPRPMVYPELLPSELYLEICDAKRGEEADFWALKLSLDFQGTKS